MKNDFKREGKNIIIDDVNYGELVTVEHNSIKFVIDKNYLDWLWDQTDVKLDYYDFDGLIDTKHYIDVKLVPNSWGVTIYPSLENTYDTVAKEVSILFKASARIGTENIYLNFYHDGRLI